MDESEKGDLTTEAERLSYDWVKKHYGHEFLFITDYSAEKRAFYHMRDENGVPQGYDLIWARCGDHHRCPARASLRGAEEAGRGEGSGR